MFQALSDNTRFWRSVWVVFAFGSALILILQYPFSASFPIGGDTTRYILRAQEFQQAITHTSYPGSMLIVYASQLVPISWPHRFILLMVLGEVLAALALARLVYVHNGIIPAGLAALAWSAAAITVTDHIESATLAQLLSLPPFIIFLSHMERLSWKTALWGALTLVMHPVTAGIAVVIGIFRLLDRTHWMLFVFVGVAIGVAAWYLLPGFGALAIHFPQDEPFDIASAVRSPVGPFMLLAPFGVVALVRKKILVLFAVLSLLLAFNGELGVPVLTSRFLSYFAITVCLFGSVGFYRLLQSALSLRSVRFVFLTVCTITIASSAWLEHESVFAFYEHPGNYARLHPDERAVIEWLNTNAPEGSLVVSTNTNRHSEWIPILSHVEWKALPEGDPFWQTGKGEYDYAVLFRHREKPEDVFRTGLEIYSLAYENKGAVIIDLTRTKNPL